MIPRLLVATSPIDGIVARPFRAQLRLPVNIPPTIIVR
jgi:hypothetical protein